MHNLESQIAAWRESMTGKVPAETIEELEAHLRETMQDHLRVKKTEAEAFELAVAQLGSAPQLAGEFQKVGSKVWWPVKAATIGGSVLALLSLFFVAAFVTNRPLGGLLATHVFAVTVGYVSVLLMGGIAVCAVGQRAFSELSASQSQSFSKALFWFSVIAGSCTAVAIALGMIWAKMSWGYSWSWDLEETGGLSVLLWSIFFLGAQRARSISFHGLMLLGLIGNMIVALAWFAPTTLESGNYSPRSYGAMALIILPSLIALGAGLLPAGWLRKKTTAD